MGYWLKIPIGSEKYTKSNGIFDTNKFKKNTRAKADFLANNLSSLTNISGLEANWTTISAFGWIFCDYEPERAGSSVLGSGGKNLAELLKQEYNYVILSMFIDSNIEEFNSGNKKGLIININFFKEFVKAFSSPAKRAELFTYKFKSENELLIVKRWMNARPLELKQEDKKIVSKDILKSLNENGHFFKSASHTSRALKIIQKQSLLSHCSEMKKALNDFRKMIKDKTTSEQKINEHLLKNSWIISFDYADRRTEKHDYFDMHIYSKEWDVSKDIIVELKTATKKVKTTYATHEVISADVGKAISQCINYLEDNKEIFDRGIVILGRDETKSAYKLNKYLHNIELLTYGGIYKKAKRVMEFLEGTYHIEKEKLNIKNSIKQSAVEINALNLTTKNE